MPLQPGYDYSHAVWEAKLDGRAPPHVDAKHVTPGFWRKKERDGADKPIAVFVVDNELWVKVGAGEPFQFNGPAAEEDFSFKTMSFCDAVEYEVYLHAVEHGTWPEQVAAPAVRHIGPGDNGPPELILQERIEALEAECREWFQGVEQRIETQEHSDKLANFSDRFRELENEAKDTREAGRKPHLDAAAAVQAVWKPLQDRAETARKWANGEIGKWQQREKARLLAEAAAAAARGEAVKADATKVKSGTRGRPVALRSRLEYRVDDADQLWAHYRDDARLRMNPAVLQTLKRLVEDDHEAGRPTPGAHMERVNTAT